MWSYYVLIPEKVRKPTHMDPPANSLVGVPSEEDLGALNQEMERLLHR
jgi:hypothetical protein